ncbi:MAG: hypothetical protein GY940_43840, partial [bacterium]|nr:hypothetical protein [bacterium]
AEIETHLLAHRKIKDVVVTVIKTRQADNSLCAYIVVPGALERGSGEDELRTYLSAVLPDYMIPAVFMFLEKLPLNANGKVDRGALPRPYASASSTYTPPGDVLEEKLAVIWAEVLGIQAGAIGACDDFFQLGGHSLKATGLVSRIHKTLHVKLPLAEIFTLPTIREQAAYIA